MIPDAPSDSFSRKIARMKSPERRRWPQTAKVDGNGARARIPFGHPPARQAREAAKSGSYADITLRAGVQRALMSALAHVLVMARQQRGGEITRCRGGRDSSSLGGPAEACDRCKFSTFGDKNQHCNLFDRGFLLWLVDRIHRGAGATLGCSGGRNCGLVENYDTPKLRFNTMYFSREFR